MEKLFFLQKRPRLNGILEKQMARKLAAPLASDERKKNADQTFPQNWIFFRG